MFTMTIGSDQVGSSATEQVLNPATEEVLGEAPECSQEQLDDAMAAAQAAYGSWRRDEAARRQCLIAAADTVKAAADELAGLLTAEQGKPTRDAAGELAGVRAWLKYYASLELEPEVIEESDTTRVEVRRQPIGPVAAITPWNFPLLLATWKIAPALRAGNTVVLKPSPFTPLATLELGRRLQAVLPPGVLNVVSGGGELGSWMSAHPAVRKVSFTGSVATGKKVAAAAAPDLKRVTLELGGNDPAVVLDDVDPAKIAGKLFWGGFINNGQTCSAIKRVYVPERMHDDLAAALADRARRARVGNGADPETQLGPLNNLPQLQRVEELVADATDQGAKVLTGGARRDGPGYFYEPTILAEARDGIRIVDEEQFGPALPLIPYRDLDEAIAHANATHFGLSGSVWSADPERGAALAAELECGTAWVNTHVALAPYQPFGGMKWSGIGVENGPWGLYGFTELQVVHVSKS